MCNNGKRKMKEQANLTHDEKLKNGERDKERIRYFIQVENA